MATTGCQGAPKPQVQLTLFLLLLLTFPALGPGTLLAGHGSHGGSSSSVRLASAGLLVATLDGGLHGFDLAGQPAWQHSLGAPLVTSSSGETPRLLPGLDGTLFLASTGGIQQVGATFRQVVDASPLKVNVVPDVYLTGERKSRVHTLELTSGGGATNATSELELETGKLKGSKLMSTAIAAPLPAADHEPPLGHLRIGSTQWSIAAVDERSHAERWSLTFRELSGVSTEPVPGDIVELWRDRVGIDGRSLRLRPVHSGISEEQVTDAEHCLPSMTAARSLAPIDHQSRVVEGGVDCSLHESLFTFDSEIVAAFAFSASDWRDNAGALGLEVIARAAPVLLPVHVGQPMFLPVHMGQPTVMQLPLPAGNTLEDYGETPLNLWHGDPIPFLRHGCGHSLSAVTGPSALERLLAPLHADLAVSVRPNASVVGNLRWLNSTSLQHCLAPRPTLQPRSELLLRSVLVAVLALILRKFWRRAVLQQGTDKGDAVMLPEVSATVGQGGDSGAAWSAVADPIASSMGRSLLPEGTALGHSAGRSLVPEGTALGHSLRNGHFAATFAEAELIGAGGFGAVYKAKHRLEGGWYAVKLVPIEGLEEGEAVAARRDFCEVSSLRRLKDLRHVVRYFTCWCEEPQFLPSEVPMRPGTQGGSHSSRAREGVQVPASPKPSSSSASVTSELSKRFFGQSAASSSRANARKNSFEGMSVDSRSSCAVCFEEPSGVHGGHERGLPGGLEVLDQRGDDARAPAAATLHREVALFGEEAPRFQALLMIQMELCTGPTLRSWLDSPRRWVREPPGFVRGRKGEALELAFAKHLMKGIREIHAADMVHRDVKPQNLFVTHDDTLKIGDFGLARTVSDRLEGEGGKVGTPAYCAPEGGARAGAPADVFSAALVILELLCPPCGTTMERARVLEALRERQVLPDHVVRELPEHARLLQRMAQAAPELRPTAEEAHAELKRLGAGTGLSPILEPATDPVAP